MEPQSLGKPDTRRPRITGAVHFAPDRKPNLPSEAIGKGYDHAESEDKAKYNESRVMTHFSSTIEFMKSGKLRVFNRDSGAIVELSKSGQVLIHAPSDLIAKANGSISIKAGSDIDLNAGGNFTVKASKIFLN